MVFSGIVRKVDDLGRVVSPKELRDTMGFKRKTTLEIFEEDNKIILRKYDPACVFCEEIKKENFLFKNKMVCPDCVKKLI